AEVRVYAAGTFEPLGSGLVDTGSGYDAQNDLPLHFGLPGAAPVDVEVTLVGRGRRIPTRVPGVDPAAYRGRVLSLRFDLDGNLVR
ncbi:MAG: ASPIC/UnbV domain-containing protein, partial [Longimicrobiales bacterium]|nr:ASPIC/UnbV domain-containing protein [Longimicrobiales bacterium]